MAPGLSALSQRTQRHEKDNEKNRKIVVTGSKRDGCLPRVRIPAIVGISRRLVAVCARSLAYHENLSDCRACAESHLRSVLKTLAREHRRGVAHRHADCKQVLYSVGMRRRVRGFQAGVVGELHPILGGGSPSAT